MGSRNRNKFTATETGRRRRGGQPCWDTSLYIISVRSSIWNTAVFGARVLSCRVAVDLRF